MHVSIFVAWPLLALSTVAAVAANASTALSSTFAEPRPVPTVGSAEHMERDGVVVIEAESGNGDWERLEEAGATVIRSVLGETMTYRVAFSDAGMWYVHLRCRLTSGMVTADGRALADHSTNDAHVTVGGVRLYGSDRTTRPEGMRCHGRTLGWWSLPKGPGGHTPDAIRPGPVFTFLPATGVYEVVLRYRSPGFVVDKIAFTRSALPPPEWHPAVGAFTPVTESGFIPFYAETDMPDRAHHRVAVRTDVHGNLPAAAEVTHASPSGRYRLTLETVAEEDGECDYEVLINGRSLGTRRNPPTELKRLNTTLDYGVVELHRGDTLRVVFAGTTNEKIPEGSGYAWARGRWRGLALEAQP
jgi:hypothetical protein